MIVAALAVVWGVSAGAPRLALLEPCAEAAGLPSIRGRAEAEAHRRGLHLEVLPAGWQGWEELSGRPPAAVLLHSLGTGDAVAVACYADAAARDRAWYGALAQRDLRATDWRRGSYVRAEPEGRVYWVGLERQALERALRRFPSTTSVQIDTSMGLGSAGPWVGRPVAPRITAPDSAELSTGERLRIAARDAWGEPVRLEAVLPHGIELRRVGPAAIELTCCSDDLAGPVVAAAVAAWAGPTRGDARHAGHRIRLTRGHGFVLPPVAAGIWASSLLAALAAVVVGRLSGWRREARRARDLQPHRSRPPLAPTEEERPCDDLHQC